WKETPDRQLSADEEANLNVFICRSCGGEILVDATTSATHCPFCGNTAIFLERLRGDLKPDYVIPFQIDKEAAKAALNNHTKGKRLLPKIFKDKNHIDEIRGIYVPFWVFDVDSSGTVKYRATRTRTWSDRSYQYTETSYFSILRSGSCSFRSIPIDGSTRMRDELMESIEPFDFTKAVDFQTAYLSGYLADRYDVDAAQSLPRANQRVKESTEQAFAGTVSGYDTVNVENSQIAFSDGKAVYALFPVWLLNTSWNGQNFVFTVNGQTGKCAGDLPLDKKLAALWTVGLTAGIGIAVYLITTLLGLF
ncbi:MAG: hypothetical protein II776_07915, partial [Clostridia bacterium]|nr:hypothetical protein [Clostridia bacterium]